MSKHRGPSNDWFFEKFEDTYIHKDWRGTLIVVLTIIFCTVFLLDKLGVI